MDIKSYQMMMQNQAMAIITSNQNLQSYQSPMMDSSFQQLLQDKIDKASMLGNLPMNQTNHLVSDRVVLAPEIGTNSTVTQYNQIISETAQTYGIDEKLIHSIIKMESNYNANAKSHAGAQGLMQLMPHTARGLGVTNSHDAQQNIEGGTKYLSQMLHRYNGNLELALAAYNAGPGNVDKHQGVPPFSETQNYVKKVMNHYFT